jgi:hypothetical protein
LFSKHFFLENKTRKSKVVKLHLISGEPASIVHIVCFHNWKINKRRNKEKDKVKYEVKRKAVEKDRKKQKKEKLRDKK